LWFCLERNKDILSVIHKDQDRVEQKIPEEIVSSNILLQDILGNVATGLQFLVLIYYTVVES
jgi:hypothetical protein